MGAPRWQGDALPTPRLSIAIRTRPRMCRRLNGAGHLCLRNKPDRQGSFHAYPVGCERRLGDQDHDHVPNHRGTARSRVRRAAPPCRTVASRATLGSWPRRRSAAVGPAAGPVMATLSNDGRRIASRRLRGKLGSGPQRSSRKHSPGSLPMGSRASSRRICTAWPRRSRVAGARPDSGRVVFDADLRHSAIRLNGTRHPVFSNQPDRHGSFHAYPVSCQRRSRRHRPAVVAHAA